MTPASNNTIALCVQKKQHTAKDIGKTFVSLCGRQAKAVDVHGRYLCLHHYNKWKAVCKRLN